MERPAYLALDVGGTEIKAWIVTEQGEAEQPCKNYPAYAQADAPTLLAHFAAILQESSQLAVQRGFTPKGIGVAFPGPFDYDKGICRLQGLGKYDSLYGMSLAEPFSAAAGGLPVRFANDADLFGLGEYRFGRTRESRRSLYLCIGTGLGSCFVADGQLVKSDNTVPANGWLYPVPCAGKTADEMLSASGLAAVMRKNPASAQHPDVKALAAAAFAGDSAAKAIFDEFGILLAETVLPYAKRFDADRLVIGGQVAKSAALFEQPLRKSGIPLDIRPDSARFAALGVITLFLPEKDKQDG